jgi:isoleucyl-tRNA synthetase
MYDWMISKKRYYGLALPIWTCECGWFDVIGDKEELKERAIEGWDAFEGHSPHRPYIDMVKIRCENCEALATRIPDVGNPWLDAGIVGFSTIQYRQDPEYWEKWFPAHFITESFPGQFRNWFYAMLAESTILVQRTPYKVCLGHGQVLAEDGREMHKSWGNAIWFDDAVETMGADVIRWIYAGSKPENNVLFGYKKANDVNRLFFMTLFNIYNFFYQYASLDKWMPNMKPKSLSPLDRWILGKLYQTHLKVTESLDNYDSQNACIEIERFVDILSKWYVRRSRRRFWKTEDNDDKRAAYGTLYQCLETLIYMMAPIIPHISEALYQRMIKTTNKGSSESVHHCRWPDVDKNILDENLMAEMDLAMTLSSMGRAARSQSNIKLRQPLQEAVVILSNEEITKFENIKGLVREELNVKNIISSNDRNRLQNIIVKPLPAKLGRKHGALYPKIRDAINGLNITDIENLETSGVVTVMVDGRQIEVLNDEVELKSVPKDEYSVVKDGNLMIGIHIDITKDLKSEGLARDLVRRIQSLRKDANFDINDQIKTYFSGDPRIEEVFQKELDYIMIETLSNELIKGEAPKNVKIQEYEIDGLRIRMGVEKK